MPSTGLLVRYSLYALERQVIACHAGFYFIKERSHAARAFLSTPREPPGDPGECSGASWHSSPRACSAAAVARASLAARAARAARRAPWAKTAAARTHGWSGPRQPAFSGRASLPGVCKHLLLVGTVALRMISHLPRATGALGLLRGSSRARATVPNMLQRGVPTGIGGKNFSEKARGRPVVGRPAASEQLHLLWKISFAAPLPRLQPSAFGSPQQCRSVDCLSTAASPSPASRAAGGCPCELPKP